MVKIAFYNQAQLERIESAKQQEDWFTAIVLSATQLERHGFSKIKHYFRELKANPDLVDTMLDVLYLRDGADCLLVLSVITKKEKDTIMKINDIRKHFVHRREKEKFKRGTEAKAEYEPLVDEAVRIL